jgi:hypothetical protein
MFLFSQDNQSLLINTEKVCDVYLYHYTNQNEKIVYQIVFQYTEHKKSWDFETEDRRDDVFEEIISLLNTKVIL